MLYAAFGSFPEDHHCKATMSNFPASLTIQELNAVDIILRKAEPREVREWVVDWVHQSFTVG